MLTLKTPCRTVEENDVGEEAGQSLLPVPTVAESHNENLKK